MNSETFDMELESEFSESDFLKDPLVGPLGTQLSQLTKEDMFHSNLTVCSAEGPDKFFLQSSQEQDKSDFVLMEGSIKLWYEWQSKCKKLKNVDEVELNGFYIGYISVINLWTRIYIQEKISEDKFHVLMIDHGLEIGVERSNIYPLRQKYCDYPAAAIPATLQMGEDKVWSQCERDMFKADVDGKKFDVAVLKRFCNRNILPFEILNVMLIEPDLPDKGKIYSFRDRYEFRYGFAEDKESPQEP